MSGQPTLAPLLEGFFTQRLMRQRRASTHTIASYRDTFRMLLRFAHGRLRKAPAALMLEDIDAPLVAAFLDELESKRGIHSHSDFYRHFYRQPARHQHWRGFPGGSAKSHLSRSIDIYRLPRRLPTPSARVRVGCESVQEAPASNTLSCCPDSNFRPFLYRHDAGRAVKLRVSLEIYRLSPLSASDLVEPDRPA